MSGGVTAAVCVVAAFVVGETILPRAFAALRRWRHKARAEAKERKEAAAKAAVLKAAEAKAAEEPKKEAKAVKVETPTMNAPSVPLPSRPIQGESPLDGGVGERETIRPIEEPHTDDAPCLTEVPRTDAERLWIEARTMAADRFKPDWRKDRDYLTRVYGAAKLGHHGAMLKLGDYAFRRGAVVEAYYWTALADLKGAKGLDASLRKMTVVWRSQGCPAEHKNVYDGFSEQQGSFARALLRIRCAINAPLARARMRELADQGCEEARLFLKK